MHKSKKQELKSITDNENEIIGVNSEGLTIICKETANYKHYYFKVSGKLTIMLDDDINCSSLVAKYSNKAKKKILFSNLYSCFSKLVENVTT